MEKPSSLRFKLTSKLIKITPRPLQLFLKRLDSQNLLNRIMTKSEGELIFQTAWVKIFKENKRKVLEHWVRYRYLEEIKRVCEVTSDTKVLDVGCGISSVLHFVEGERFGIDPLAAEYLKMYQYPAGISVKKGVGEKIPFSAGFFDVVFCSNVLDHTDNPSEVISEIARVLKNDGNFILTVSIFDQSLKRDWAHPHTFTEEDVLSLISGNFQIVFKEMSPAVGLYAYVVNGLRENVEKELILILKKKGIINL